MKNYENVKLTNHEIPYSKIVEYIKFVVENSYSKENGAYHEYLMDYSEALAILSMYTNYDENDYGFDDIMAFIQSSKWDKIKEELGDNYINFHYYVKKEIEYLNTPMRKIDHIVNKFSDMVDEIEKILDAIDIDTIKQYDFSKLVNIIETINESETETSKK